MSPTVLNPRSVAQLGAKPLVVTGDHGLGARRVRAVLPDLPEATVVVLDDYAGLTWTDFAADRASASMRRWGAPPARSDQARHRAAFRRRG